MSEAQSVSRLQARIKAILSPEANFTDRYIPDYEELGEVVRGLRAQGKKIVMTKGVYDLIHVGHARYISEARRHGDILLVSIDSDKFTRMRKGENRPIVNEDERIEMILHLRYVDIVTIREVNHGMEEDIEVVRPDILVTSATTVDYTKEKKETLREMYGLEVITLEAQAQTSTTARIRTLMIDGAQELGDRLKSDIDDFLSKLRA